MTQGNQPEDPVDETSEDSFPASDPPSWTATTVGTVRVPDNPPAAALNARIARLWWVFALRGALALLFALLALISPIGTLFALVLLFAAYCLADGICSIMLAVQGARHGSRWGPLALNAVLALGAAAISLFFPALSLYVFAIIVAAWAIATGVVTIVAAFRLHYDHGRWWMIAGGAMAAVFGLILAIWPPLGLVVLLGFFVANAVLFGVAMLALAWRLRERRHHGAATGAAFI